MNRILCGISSIGAQYQIAIEFQCFLWWTWRLGDPQQTTRWTNSWFSKSRRWCRSHTQSWWHWSPYRLHLCWREGPQRSGWRYPRRLRVVLIPLRSSSWYWWPLCMHYWILRYHSRDHQIIRSLGRSLSPRITCVHRSEPNQGNL